MQWNNPAQRRYTWRFLTAMSLYAVALIAAQWGIRTFAPSGVALVAWSVLPALPLLGAIAAMGLYLQEETDEYLRALVVRGLTIATGLLLAVCTVWGFLEEGGVVPHVAAWTVFPIWAVCLGIAQGYCRVRARFGSPA